MTSEINILPLESDTEYAQLLDNISELWTRAKGNAALSVNTELLMANWETGRYIVEFEQGGAARAQYGAQLLVKQPFIQHNTPNPRRARGNSRKEDFWKINPDSNIWLIKNVLPTRLRPYNATNSERWLSAAAFNLAISVCLHINDFISIRFLCRKKDNIKTCGLYGMA